MSTSFVGEGNIGFAPDYREFANGNRKPGRLPRHTVPARRAGLRRRAGADENAVVCNRRAAVACRRAPVCYRPGQIPGGRLAPIRSPEASLRSPR
ncbi:hypothetical protein D9M69_234010 [compost metagenome]